MIEAPPELHGPLPRLLLLCAGDPDSERAFSGSARALFHALESHGCVVAKANVLGITDPFKHGPLWLRATRRFDRLGLEDRYRWSAPGFARNSRRARAAARQAGPFDACLMYGTTYLPALDHPTYCYFDATFAQVYAAKAWGFANFSPGHAAAIHRYQSRVYAHCAGIFPRTAYAANSVIEDFGVPSDKVCIAGAGPNHFAAPLPHAAYDTQSILFVGGEFERKGGPLLLDAFRLVRERLPQARLRIVGCSPAIDEPGVEVLGRISKDAPGGLDRLLQCYSEASVFCIMSEFEPFGIVVLEAANSYVPCVAPNRFAFPETVQHGVTGRLVPPGNSRALADTLTEMLQDPEALRQMGQAAHAHVHTRWTWDAAAKRIIARIQADLARHAVQ